MLLFSLLQTGIILTIFRNFFCTHILFLMEIVIIIYSFHRRLPDMLLGCAHGTLDMHLTSLRSPGTGSNENRVL